MVRPMTQISIQEIARDPLTFVNHLETGVPLLIVRGGIAIAEVQPVSPAADGSRPFGLASGEFMAPDDFDGPLPNDVISLFEGA